MSASVAATTTADENVAEEQFDPETKQRLWRLRDHSSIRGSTGILRTQYAGSAPVGTFRFGLLSSYYGGTGYLCPQCEAPNGGRADVEDEVSRVGAHVQLSATPLEFLEAYVGIHSTATSNSRGAPELLQVLGDTTWGVKGFMPFEEDRVFSAGGGLELWFLNGTGGVGIDGLSLALRGLATADFSNRSNPDARVPMRLNLNLSYIFDNSGNLVEDIEKSRREGISRIERYGLNVNRIDRLVPAIGIEGMWDVVRPYFEWSMDIPSNRQGYSCLLNDVGAGDSCLKNDPRIQAAPGRITLGARAYPFMDNLAFHLALDLATGATKAPFWQEVQPETPWNFYFGVAYAVDTKPAVKIRTVAAEAPTPVVAPPQYFISGSIFEAGSEGNVRVQNAVVRYEGRTLTGMATDESGSFYTASLEPGAYTFSITANGYEPGTCNARIDPTQLEVTATPTPPAQEPNVAPAASAQPAAAAPPPAAAPSVAAAGQILQPIEGVENQYVLPVRCELKALPKVGNVDGFLLDGTTNKPVPAARVTITDPLGRSLTLDSDEQGAFRFENVPPGTTRLSVEARGFLPSAQEVEIVSRKDVQAQLYVHRVPRRPNIIATPSELRLKQPITFVEGTAKLTPASQGLVDELAALLKTREEIGPVEIQVHTDNTGAPDYNMQLSTERASAVRDALIRNGVEASRLVARGYGDTEPLAANASERGRARNNRVQLKITK